ncbi:LOW QUALITY PROTEIN: uncharacterized protein EMH_0079460 [Eimeria mitis]|uniref:Uncharacterized protein n=1 Tax=Eimeria mitis TaxID=44415 RepID=U6JQB6_9EIME|nr:LOW QUALITY PROTEIN: uncharacterized protein EMH_0079460 [Eimeria mitis]CDJ27046.1 hypothetical protein, conserved [Eimeria mitis]
MKNQETKQGHRNRLKQQQIERQQQGSKGAEHQGDRREQHDQKQQIGPFEMHEQHAYSPRHEDYEREHLASREYAASNSGEICGTDLQQQRHHTLPLDGSASSSAADRSLQGSPFAADCTDQAEGTQRRNSSQCLEEDGEKQLPPLHHMPEGWLQHEMQALLREEYQQRQIVQRREEQQHEALQQHPPLERPWVFLAQKQQEEDFRRMHQATLQQMQQELLNRHERQIQARLQEDTRTQQGDAENERQEAIRLKQQQKQNHQKQLRIQQPTGSSKARSTPITRRRTIFWQHRQEEQPKDQPLEIQNTEEKSQKQFEEEEHRLQLQREEVRQTQNQQQQQKQEQPYSPAGEKEEDTGKTPKQQEQQLGPLQQTETTYETEGVAPSQTGKQRELVQTQQQPTQTQEHAQQVQQQQQHDTAVHEEVSKLLQQSEATSPESSKQKVQQALQKDGTSAYGEEGQQKQQLLTQREGHEQQQSNADGEQTSSRQPKAWELQKGEDNPKQKGQTERDENHRGKQNQQRPYQADQQTQQHSSDGLEVPEHHGEKRLPDTRTQKHKLAQQEGRENEQQGLGVAVLPQARKQLASKEKQKITHQQQQEGVREIKHRRGQTQADNQRMRTQQHNEQPKQRWLQQKEHHQSLSRSSQPQTRVQRPQQQPQQQQQENMQEQQQRQEQKHQQQQEIHQQKEHHLERQGLQQEQQQRLNKHQEGNSTLTRAELLRLSFTPLAAVRDNELYLHHHLPNRNSSLPLGHGGATTSAQQPSSRIRLPDTPIQPHVATPRGGLNEGRRSGNAKAPPLLPQHADGRHFSKGQQSLPNQRWTPLQIPQQQSRESKLAESKSANNLFRRRNPIPPPPPPVASITQSLQHPEEQWKMAPMRGIHQPKNPRSRQRQLHQEQRRLQKQPKQPAVHLPVRVPENPAGHRETQQNAQRQNAALHQDVQQQQQLQGYYQHVPHDLAASASSKRGAKRNSRSSHSGAGEPDPFSPFVSGSRPTWAQKAVEGPPKREFRNDRDHRTEEALRMSVEAEGSVVKADLGRTDNEQAAGECIDGQDRRFGKSEMFLNRQLPDMQGYTHRRERQEQRLKEQTLEQKQRDRLNPIVLQVHQQLEQARLEFLEEQTRGQARSGRVQLVKEARKQEDQQQQSLDEAEPKQGGERHELPQPHQQQQHQQQQEQQRQEQHENSMPSPYPVCHQQQPVSGSGQLQQEQQQQQERQHPYGGHQQEQRRGHPEQQLQQGEEVRYLPRSDIQQPSQPQAPNELQHQSQQQQLPEGMERHRQHFQQQDAWPQQRARQSQHPLGMQQQVWFQQHQQQDQQYQQERLRPTQQQQQQHQPPPQEPFIYEQQYTNPPQQSQPAMPLLHPLVEQQQQQAWLQAQLHLSLQQQQHAWLLINQQRSWLLQQHHPLTPSQQHLWTLQQQQFWQQQQLLWQLQQPHAWLQQQQHIWLQHHQQAHLQQQLLHRQQNQQQHQHGLTSFQYGLNCIKPYAPPHVLSDTILGAAENAANIRHFLSCGMRMPPPWDGCIPSENMSLGFCRVCLQYVDRDRYMPPVVSATAVASSPAVMTGVEEAADDFHEQEPHQAEFLSHEQRISTASADAAGGPPGVSLLPEAASGRADCATEVHDDTFQQVNATAMFSNNNSNNSPTIHNSNNSVNDRGGIYDEYPTSSSNTSGSNSINNSRSRSRTSNTAQRNHRMNMTNWEEGDGGSNNHGDNNMATDSASFGTFQPPDFSREDSSGSSGQIDSIVETHQNQLHQHLQQQLQEGPPRSRGLVAEASAGAPNRNPTSFSALNPSAPVFVPARNTQPASPTFASAIAAAAAAANQETLAASIQGNPTAETRQWNTQQTNPRAPMNFCGQIYPTALQQQQRNQQPQQQSQNQQREPQGILEVQFPPANGQTTCDLQPNVQQPQLANQSLQHLPQSYQHLNPQRHQQQQNAPQQNEQQSNEQPAQQQHYPFPSFISSSLSDFVPFLDSSTRQGSLIVTGVCLQCWQFVVRPPVLCLLDQLRAKGIGPDATENCQPIKYEE